MRRKKEERRIPVKYKPAEGYVGRPNLLLLPASFLLLSIAVMYNFTKHKQ